MEGNKVQCKFCVKVLNGGISRMKFHLSKTPSKGVHPCTKVPDEVAERVRAIVAMKDENKEVHSAKKPRLAESTPRTFQAAKLPVPQPETRPQLMPKFTIMGTKCHSTWDSEKCIAHFFFENKLDFSIAQSSSYQLMLESIGGPGFQGPSPEALKTTWLPKLQSDVSELIKDIEKDWVTTGCTLLAESWAEDKSKAFISFSVSSPLGTFFYKSVDAAQKGQKGYFDLFDSVIQELGPENVVQVITDGNLDFGNLGNQIMMTYGTIFWSPCASHCINLMLEDFTKIEWVNRCIVYGKTITRFIYNHSWVLNLLKKFTGEQDVVRTGLTKSISDILTLQVLLKHRSRLKHMFNCPEYTTSSFANKPQSMTCIDILDDNEFWRAVEEIAAVAEPLLRVLRDVSGCKPTIGTIYESMTRVKDSIRTYYIMDDVKCNTFQEIVDRRWLQELHTPLHAAAAYLNPSIHYNPEVKFLSIIKEDLYAVLEKLLPTAELRQDMTQQLYIFKKAQGMFGSNLAKESRNTTAPGIWWEQYGDSVPALQRVAVRILSQACSTSSWERNWATIQQLHLEKRNKLDKETQSSIVYVQNNLRLQLKPQRKAGADPIAHDGVDMTSEWVEEVEAPSPSQWLDRFPALDCGDLNQGWDFGSRDLRTPIHRPIGSGSGAKNRHTSLNTSLNDFILDPPFI